MHTAACGGQRMTYRSWFSPVIVWILEVKLRLAGLNGNSDGLKFIIFNKKFSFSKQLARRVFFL